MIDDQNPKELLLREISNMRYQLTALKASEVEHQKLKRDIECFSLLSHEMLCIIELDGSFTYLNHATEKILGFTRDELLLKPFVDLIHPHDRQASLNELKKLSSAISIVSFICRCMRKTNSYRWLNWTVTYVAEDEVFYAVSHDVTTYKEAEEAAFKLTGDQKHQQAVQKKYTEFANMSKKLQSERLELRKIEGELQKARQQVKDSQRAQSNFITRLNHEIRAPLSGIVGMTEIALDSKILPEKEEYFKTVKTSADSLLNMINSLADLSKIESGEFKLEMCDFLLRDSLDKTIKLLTIDAQKKGVNLSCTVDHDAPDTLFGDPWRVRQVIINLISYILKLKTTGEISLKVKNKELYDVSSQKSYDSSLFHFTVSHRGRNISQQQLQNMKDLLLYSTGSSSEDIQSTDLSLTICTQLVKLMGGKIWLEMKEEMTIHFTLPFKNQNGSSLRCTASEPPILIGLSVLVVDSNSTNRDMVRNVLTRWGMKLTVAESSDEAVKIVEETLQNGESFSLVILDSNLPQTNGFTLAQKLRQYKELSEVTIIMLTFCGQRGDAQRCRNMGISAYLTKPIKKTDLYEAIIKSLSNDSRNNNSHSLITRYSLRADRQRLCILLAENDIINQELTICMLEKRGHVVVVVKNGDEALQMLNRVVFDLILINQTLPDMKAQEVVTRIREKKLPTGDHIPIIVLKDKNNNSHSLHNVSVDGFLTKPINMKDMFEMVDRVIEDKIEELASYNSTEDFFDWKLPDDLSYEAHKNVHAKPLEHMPYLSCLSHNRDNESPLLL